jgi:hypothetical protein
MRLPQESAGYAQRVSYGCYTEAALISEGFEVEAGAVRTQIDHVKTAGRAFEDHQEKLFGARARRDLAAWHINRVIQTLGLGLRSRGLDAMNKPPYTLILPDGIIYYIEAPIPQLVQRVTLLKERAALHLDPADPLRVALLNDIEAPLNRWLAAQSALEEARRQRTHASQVLDTAERTFDKVLTDIWADRVKAEDKARAERFFTKLDRKATSRTAEPGPPDAVA